ncbi:MAG: flagellar motor protein MotB [Bdellovibrionales bacterium]
MSPHRDDQEDSPNPERWTVSFADFMTLMFALFAVLYATSNRDLEKTKQFQESVKRYLIKAGAFGGSGEKINQGEQYNNPIESPIQTYNQASPLSKETFDEAEKFVEDTLSSSDRKKFVMDIAQDALGVRLVLSGAAVYADNSAKFRPEALAFLERLGELLGRIGRKVMIEGHIDRVKINNPSFASDWEFSGARATSLVRYLIKRHKMDASLFVPVAYGASRPLPSRKSDNDRLEVVIMTEELPL